MSVTVPTSTAEFIEDLLLNYNENNGSYTDIGIAVDNLPKLLVRPEYLTNTDTTAKFEDIFYDDISVFKDMADIKTDLMEWYHSKYAHHDALYTNMDECCIQLSKFAAKPVILKSGDTSKYMVGFIFSSNTDRATISDMSDLIEYMRQLKESARIPETATINRFIIGTNDWEESAPGFKALASYVEASNQRHKEMNDWMKQFTETNSKFTADITAQNNIIDAINMRRKNANPDEFTSLNSTYMAAMDKLNDLRKKQSLHIKTYKESIEKYRQDTAIRKHSLNEFMNTKLTDYVTRRGPVCYGTAV
jgi:hypothetical protein